MMDPSFEMPDFPKYDRTKDPQEHVAPFELDLKIDMMVSILIHGLKNGPLAFALARDPPEDVEHLIRVTQKYIDEEDINATKDGEWQRSRERSRWKENRDKHMRADKERDPPYPSRFHKYTPPAVSYLDLQIEVYYSLSHLVQEKKEGWLLHVDGSSNANNGGAGILSQGPNEVEIEVAARLSFTATNNEAEYEALILGFQLAYEAGARELDVCTNSQLVAMQVKGAYETRERTMMQYLIKVKELMAKFDKCMVQQIPRNENERADTLSKFGAMVAGIKSRKVMIMIKEHPSIGEAEEVQVLEDRRSWKSDLVK
ncbi:UNVERIFIED_CONTAM: Ribonuclease HI [Sesamum radiatum]|uniref:Ribonuclease HI n=1 Tax=Sesamum radiatum TaxID=300843 RepID=A0AAW2K911_SESRA